MESRQRHKNNANHIVKHEAKQKENSVKENSYEKCHQYLDVLDQKTTHDDSINSIVKKIINEFSKLNSLQQIFSIKSNRISDGKARSKEFVLRNSLLTDLFEANHHLRTLYNIFIVILSILMLQAFAHNAVYYGDYTFGLSKLVSEFKNWHYFIFGWFCLFTSTLAVYFAFGLWATVREYLKPQFLVSLWDYSWVLSYLIYQLVFLFVFGLISFFYFDLTFSLSMTIYAEQARLSMKVHSFIRTNAPNVLAHHKDKTNKSYKMPALSQYLYFIFAPTLIYRDNYPRTKKIRWNIFFWHITEIVMCLFIIFVLLDRSFIPKYRNFGTRDYNTSTLFVHLIDAAFPAIFIFMTVFYLVLHAWCNAWAEILRFGDRLFYLDWWNATSYSEYYRKWNIVVHDWLYTYIYKDSCDYIFSKNYKLSFLNVFFISAVIHEYIIALSVRFFFPVLFLSFFGVGVIAIFITMLIKQNGGHLFMWLTLFTGNGLLISSYLIEHYARINCISNVDSPLLDFFVLRSLSCIPKE